jgi:hypothetical protein
MLGCTCVDLPETFYLDQAPVGWSDHLDEIATGSWKTLRRCSVCNAAFAVDVWDKYQEQVVVRLAERTQWEERPTPSRSEKPSSCGVVVDLRVGPVSASAVRTLE